MEKKVTVDCQACGAALQVPERLLGRIATCPKCKAKTRLRAEPGSFHGQTTIIAKELLAKLQGYKRPKSPRAVMPRGQIIMRRVLTGMAVVAVVALLAAGYWVYRSHKAAEHGPRTDLVLVRKLGPIREKVEAGRKKFEQKQYAESKKILDAAQAEMDTLLDQIINALAAMPDEVTVSGLQKLRDDVIAERGKVVDLLRTGELTYGSKGYVLFEGEWMPPEEKKRIEEERREEEQRRFAMEQRKKGLVLYNGKWVTEDEKYRAMGMVKFQGEWMTPRERTERLKEMAKATLKRKGTRGRRRRPGRGFARNPSQPQWVLDDFERGNFWTAEQWGDPCKLTIREVNASKALNIHYEPGPKRKIAISRGLGADLSSRNLLSFDALNESGRKIKIAVAFHSDRYYESTPIVLRPGFNPDVGFAIKSPMYKCEIDKWQSYSHPLGAPERVNRIYFVLESSRLIDLNIDNIKLLAKK